MHQENNVKLNAGKIDIAIVIVSLVLIELVFRSVAPLVSGNVKQISEMTETANSLAADKSSVLFLGNSLMGNALDLAAFDEQSQTGMSSYKAVPDGTSLWDWSCIVNGSFIDEGKKPGIIVIGYAWEQVGPVPSRLGGFFCDVTELPDLVRLGMNNGSDVFEFLAAKVSRLYAMHETVRKRVLGLIIPDYNIYTQIINSERNKKQRAVVVADKKKDYKLLNSYLSNLERNNIESVIIAMPVKEKYDLDEGFYQVVNNYKGVVLDYRQLDGLSEDAFRDPIHLNEKGNEIFTRKIANYFNDVK